MKIKTIKVLFTCAAVSLMPFSVAYSNTQLGYGLTTCKQYEQLRKQSPVAEQIFEGWILGYLSGINFIIHTTKGIDLLAGQDSKIISDFIKDYCSINPNITVTGAANEYWFKLSDQQE